MGKKYVLIDDTIEVNNRILHRIKALKNFGGIYVGYLGGYIESEDNLSHDGDCWISGIAYVYNNARVCGNAWVGGDAQVYENANVSGGGWVRGKAQVCGNARVCGDAHIYERAAVYENSQICEDSRIGGDARVCGDAYVGIYRSHVYIEGNLKLDHGVWTQHIRIDDRYYLISSTLETVSLGHPYEKEI